MDPLKNRRVGKTGPQGIKTFPFVSSHMKDSAEVILFHIKSRGAQGLVFVQIKFENCTTNFYFENGEISIIAINVNM